MNAQFNLDVANNIIATILFVFFYWVLLASFNNNVKG